MNQQELIQKVELLERELADLKQSKNRDLGLNFSKVGKMFKKRFVIPAGIAAVVLMTSIAIAATIPNSFTSGTVISSSAMNANFTYIKDRLWELTGSDLNYTAGNVGIGTSTPSEALEVYGNVSVVNESAAPPGVQVSAADDTNVPGLWLSRAGGSFASPTANLDNDYLGFVGSYGHDGTDWISAPSALMTFQANEDFAPGANGTRIIFSTTSNGTVDLTPRLSIQNNGDLMQTNYGDETVWNRYGMLKARGAFGSETAVLADDMLGFLGASGFNGSEYPTALNGGLGVIAAEDFTTSANGTYLGLFTTESGTAITSERMRITDTGFVGIGTTDPTAQFSIANEGATWVHHTAIGDGPAVDVAGYALVRARGTAASMSAVQFLDTLGYLGATGHAATGFPALTNVGIHFYAAENFTDTANGAGMSFYTTTNGEVAKSLKMVLTDDGNLGIGNDAPNSDLAVSGENEAVTIESRAFGDDAYAHIPNHVMARARGTTASPAAVQALDLLGFIGSYGHDGTAFATTASAGIAFGASENFAAGEHGSYMVFETTPIDSDTKLTRMLISDAGNVGIGTTSPTSKLAVAGLPSGTDDSVASGTLAGAVCITTTGNMYIDTDGICDN